MKQNKSTFALYFGNRGFFPASLISSARQEMKQVLEGLGYGTLMLDAGATRHGAVETTTEGEVYANFLKANQGKYDGVILCLPNFGDETGAIAALKDAGVPIFIQAYPDEMDKMGMESRRDAFCGKVSIMNVFKQYGLKFTIMKPHTVSPSSSRFKQSIDYFDRLCKVYKGVRRMTVGAIGARTTAFKTVRIDETTLQRNGITVETIDLSDVFARVNKIKAGDPGFKENMEQIKDASTWKDIPEASITRLTQLYIALQNIIEEYKMDAISLRCWTEMQSQLGVSPCVLLGMLDDVGIPAACEVDVGNAVMMYALQLASGNAATCLDWNNNYKEDEDKCILFHCGPVPPSLMAGKGRISDQLIIANSLGKGCGYGCNVGRIKPMDFTFGRLLTDAGKIRIYLGEGSITDDYIPEEFFGCAGVANIRNLQDVMLHIGHVGHRHHVSIAPGFVMGPVCEALGDYLGFEVAIPQNL